MLQTLHIQNLALFEAAEWSPGSGLNVVSGETGGGKSLLIRALQLLRGDRPPAQGALVRHGQKELRIDGEFRLPAEGPLAERLRAHVREVCGVDLEDDLLVLTRIVDRQGRSRVRIAGRPATLAALRALGEQLLEVHGQGDTRMLARPDSQCELLDEFARCGGVQRQFAAALAHARQLDDALQQARDGAREREQKVEFLRFQHREMTELQLGEGELPRLEQEHRRLANLDQLRAALQGALVTLQDDESCAVDALSRAARGLQDAIATDEALQPAGEQLAAAQELVSEVCRQLQSGLARLELDPGRLVEVEARLAAVHEALRRHGPTEERFRQRLAAVEQELAAFDDGVEDPAQLAAALEQAVASAAAVGRRLLRARRRAAKDLAARVSAQLRELGMPHTEVRAAMAADFRDEELLVQATPQGPVPVDLEVRINPGEPFRSMRQTASGGELARIVLAIKRVLAEHDGVPVLVFDEIDAEVGGRLGAQVGAVLTAVARHHQVVVVTHLPQVAGCGERHFFVSKEVADAAGAEERTSAEVRVLSGKEVERELSAMAGGSMPQVRRRARTRARSA